MRMIHMSKGRCIIEPHGWTPGKPVFHASQKGADWILNYGATRLCETPTLKAAIEAVAGIERTGTMASPFHVDLIEPSRDEIREYIAATLEGHVEPGEINRWTHKLAAAGKPWQSETCLCNTVACTGQRLLTKEKSPC